MMPVHVVREPGSRVAPVATCHVLCARGQRHVLGKATWQRDRDGKEYLETYESAFSCKADMTIVLCTCITL